MYCSNGFRVAIVVNGNELRIHNGINVFIPFDTEYSVLVRNDNDMKAKFSLEIDGVTENESFVINPNTTMKIERFMCGNLQSGNKFKFVSINDSRVQDKNNNKNGLICVKLWKELEQKPFIATKKWYERYNFPYYPYEPYYLKKYNPHYEITWGDIEYGGATSWNCSVINSLQSTACCNNFDDKGATIEGTKSNQQFIHTEDFQTEIFNTVLELQLKGRKILNPSNKFCVKCGNEFLISNHEFCGKCGTKR